MDSRSSQQISKPSKDTKRIATWRYVTRALVLLALIRHFVLSPASPSAINVVEQAQRGIFVPDRRIDTHAHFIPPFYYDILKQKGLSSGGRPIPKWNVSEHLNLMDDLHIETAIVAISAPGARLEGETLDAGRKLARKLNEYGHMLALTHPGRFQFWATLTLPDVEGSIAEAIYALDTLKAAGVVLLANSEGEYLGSKKFDPLMEVLNARDAVVFVHPNSIPVPPKPEHVEDTGVPDFVMDFLLDTTRAAANLVLKDVIGRYPNIKFILSHSGGFMPFAAYRMAGALTFLSRRNLEITMEQLKSFYVDTALASSPSALPSTVAFIPNNQITFGSDFPFAPTFGIKIASSQLDLYPLAVDKMEEINFSTADKLFSKPLGYWRKVWSDAAEPFDSKEL